jgi:hypothetical protein
VWIECDLVLDAGEYYTTDKRMSHPIQHVSTPLSSGFSARLTCQCKVRGSGDERPQRTVSKSWNGKSNPELRQVPICVHTAEFAHNVHTVPSARKKVRVPAIV